MELDILVVIVEQEPPRLTGNSFTSRIGGRELNIVGDGPIVWKTFCVISKTLIFY